MARDEEIRKALDKDRGRHPPLEGGGQERPTDEGPEPDAPLGPEQDVAVSLDEAREEVQEAVPLAESSTRLGSTPAPDSDRLRRTMERSGAYRSMQAPRSQRRTRRESNEAQRRQERFHELYEQLMDKVRASSEELGYDAARPVLSLPPVPPGHREVESTSIVPERAAVRILFDTRENVYVYEVIEPQLSENEKEILHFLRDTLVRTLDGRPALEGTAAEDVLAQAVREAIVDHRILIDEVGILRIEYYLIRDFLGFGPIDVLMRDPMIEDISCDGPNVPIFLFHRQYESLRTTVAFHDELELDSYVIRLAQRSGKHISIADPLLDATLPDGSRLQATLGREVTTRGSSFTVRKFRGDPLTPPDLVRYGTMSAEMAAYFWFAMEQGNSFILAGGTASGKTTSLNAICQFIPPEKKIVSIEDTREINLAHENWIAGVTRSGFGGEIVGGKPAGTIDMYKLLEAALRQRPEYLLVGEVRGPEALTLFQAMATGHSVYSTMHADSAQSAVYRLENRPIEVPRMMLQTLDLLLMQTQARLGDRLVRRIREVVEIVGFDPETRELLTNTVFEWRPGDDTFAYLGKSYVFERIMESRNLSDAQIQDEWRRRAAIIEHMVREDIRVYTDVARIVSRYYRDPQGLLKDVHLEAPHAS